MLRLGLQYHNCHILGFSTVESKYSTVSGSQVKLAMGSAKSRSSRAKNHLLRYNVNYNLTQAGE
jgi:hypothetical protein